MIYNSLEFIFFVAFGLFAYSLANKALRIYVLFIMSIYWYCTWSVLWAAVFLIIAAINYILLKVFSRRSHANAGERFFFVALLSFNVLVLVLMKSRLPLFLSGWIGEIKSPFGASIFMFMLIAFVVDSWRKSIQSPPSSFAEFSASVMFFPLLVSGPIERFNHLGGQLKRLESLKYENIVDGILIFSLGFAKKMWLGEALDRSVAGLFTGAPVTLPVLVVGGILGIFQAYINLSSYCDMARGVARCFGIRLGINFLPFYYARNPNEFWQRWHISLGTWLRDYITFPALLRFRQLWLRYAIILLAFTMIGIWHGFAVHWLYFGLLNGLLIVTFLYFQNGPFLRHPRVVRGIGFFLVFWIYVASGIFQYDWSGSIAELFKQDAVMGDRSGFLLFLTSLRSLGPVFVAILVLDYAQEKRKNPDFFIELPLWTRSIAALFLFMIFLFFENNVRVTEVVDTLPIYFRF